MADASHLGTQFHQMTREEFEQQPGVWFHGTATGMIGSKPDHPQFHVGTQRAALQALGARLHGGNPGGTVKNENGRWYQPDEPYHRVIAHARQTNSPNADVIGGHITGPMANVPKEDPREERFGRSGFGDYQGRAPYAYGDWVANGMEKRLKHQGVFYKNVGEDTGSISAILPKRSHFTTHEDYLVEARAQGKKIPKRAMRGYKEIPGQGKLF